MIMELNMMIIVNHFVTRPLGPKGFQTIVLYVTLRAKGMCDCLIVGAACVNDV